MGGILSTDKSSSAEELQFFLNLLRLSRVVEDGKADKETWKEIAKVIGMYREYLKTNLPATKEVKTTLNKTIPSHAVEGKQEKNKEKRLVDIEIRNPFNKTTPRMKIQGHEPLLFLQKGIGNYPDLSTLEGVKLFPVKEVDLEAGTKSRILFYVVNHTARLESVNLNPKTLGLVEKLVGKDVTVIVLALTPGNIVSALAAPKKLSTGEEVITLYYQNKKFVDTDNQDSYKRLRDIYAQHYTSF